MSKLMLPKIISDGMVIQRRKRIHIWGWDEPGTSIEVHLDNLVGRGAADEKGRFDLAKAHPAVYSHGEYYALGKQLGSFGYSVRKKDRGRKRV